MGRRLRIAAILCVCSTFAVACSASHAARPASTSTAGPPAKGAPARVTNTAGLPLVQLQVGTALAPGIVAASCAKAPCARDAAARPATELEATKEGLLLFLVSRAPASARIEIARRSGGAVVEHASLRAGSTTIAFHESLPKGRYVIALEAGYGGRFVSWVFGLKVPARRG